MTFDALLIHTVTVFNPSVDVSMNRYGDEELEWDDGTVVRARVQQDDAEEIIINRDTRVTTYTAFLPYGTTISALSIVEWDTRRFRVVGRPDVVDGLSAPHHLEAKLEEVEG